MTNNKISGSFGSLRFDYQHGEYYIFVDKEDVKRVVIRACDSGIPGVIGPDIDIRLQDAVTQINQQETFWNAPEPSLLEENKNGTEN